ncbi:MAG: alginate O-acetyltransferase AlgX-related protein [Planctomycetota bacterium]
MKKGLKYKLKRYLLFPLITLLIVFLIFEVAFIVLEPYLFKGLYEYDRDIGFRVRGHVYGYNRFGFNDHDYPLEKAPGTYRIVVLGDSFSYSGGKTENYIKVLEKMFAKRYQDKRVEVLNIGYPQTHTGEQLIMLQKFGFQFDPDLVVLGFFVGNDIIDAERHRKRIVLNDVYFDIDKRHELVLFGIPIVPRSRFLTFLSQKFQIFSEPLGEDGTEMQKIPQIVVAKKTEPGAVKKKGKKKGTTAKKKEPAEGAKRKKPAKPPTKEKKASFSDETYWRIEYHRMEICSLTNHAQHKFEDHFAFTFENILEMKRLLEERDIKFLVGIYPDEFQIDPELRKKVLVQYEMKEENYDLELPQNRLREFLDTNQIPFEDLLPAFRALNKKQRLYLPNNSHWNKDGNYLAAELLYPRIRELMDSP